MCASPRNRASCVVHQALCVVRRVACVVRRVSYVVLRVPRMCGVHDLTLHTVSKWSKTNVTEPSLRVVLTPSELMAFPTIAGPTLGREIVGWVNGLRPRWAFDLFGRRMGAGAPRLHTMRR